MDVLYDNALDNNNNVIPFLNNNDQNQIDLNVPLVNLHEDMNNIMENNRVNENIEVNNADAVEVLNNLRDDEFEEDANEGTSNQNNENDIFKADSSLNIENGPNVPSNPNSQSSTRKSKKRKRHYNLNKNKKWNKPYKRQKPTNTSKSDAENMLQNTRNKHLYTKVPKIIFNNKQAMHRGGGVSKFFLPDKRPRKDIIVPPTKFLLGGNISDPLNLNSLQDEALVSMGAVTPKSSPMTTPPKVEVIIPPNIYDPLHLLDPVDSVEYEKQLVSPLKARRLNKQRSRKKKIRKSVPDISTQATKKFENQDVPTTADTIQLTASPPTSIDISNELSDSTIEYLGSEIVTMPKNTDEKFKFSRDLQLDLSTVSNSSGRKRKFSEGGGGTCCATGNGIKKLRRFDSKDKIVSPVIPQPGAWKRPPKVLLGAPRNRIRTTSTSDADNSEEPNSNKRSDSSLFEQSKSGELHATVHKKECSPERAIPIYESSNSTQTANNTAAFGFNKETVKYQFGNYVGQNCGLQNSIINLSDVRLTVFLRHAYLFKDKDILDIGCSTGHMTIAVGRKLNPKSIVGVDIDKKLISRARRNLRIFQRIPESESQNLKLRCKPKFGENIEQSDCDYDREKSSKRIKSYFRVKDRERQSSNQVDFFPLTFPICFGGFPNVKYKNESPSASPASNSTQNLKISEQSAVAQQDQARESCTFTKLPNNNEVESTIKIDSISNGAHKGTFPDNVFFRTLDYAVTDEIQMVSDKQQYDLILCLSLTKWVHLNFGDAGLKMTFRRMFNQLRPGGKLILEAQNWASYKKRKKLSPNIYNNYKNIEFFPNNFHEFLLSPEVGFSHSYTLGVPRHSSKGFYRPIQLYIKGDFTPSQVRWSDTYHPQTPYEPMIRYSHYVDPMRISIPFGAHWNYKMTNMYKHRDTPFPYSTNRYNTPSHGISSSTSRYYNPLETDSYLPSYDNVVQTRHYCFASPLYSTVWSPPPSGRRSASQTPLFGSIRRVDSDDQDSGTKHVYLTPRGLDGSTSSSRSNDENSPQTQHVYAIGSSRSSDLDTNTNTNSPKHVYAFQ
ncbi:7SK snRNA methylphosphate capping enzyme bin3 [Sitodiplosis mosellana]|uniref:7SK snRNA methylphosphate capping enzyme bin3 n=1 Tax=Sitodiplosis mosellana TaxID=263140 RepID=UPI002443DE2E|nr:7SK snRNA methylphosphate capping enzyme bin3 [Sitodiplosis mosellana]